MDYIQIQRFLMIVKHLNLSEAAKELYITQPALSLSLANLEKELGIQLFYRVRNGLVLTPEGEKLLSSFEHVKEAYEQLDEKKLELQKPRESVVRLGCHGNSLLYATFSMGNLLQVEGLTVKMISADGDTAMEMLKNGQLDFVISPRLMEDRAIGNINLYRENIAIVTSKNHRLAERDSLKLKDLQEEKLFGLSRQHHFRNLCDRLCYQKGYPMEYQKEMNTLELYRTIEQHRDADDYIAFTAEDSFETLYGDGYVKHEIQDADFTQTTVLSFMAERKLQYSYEDFVNHVVKCYPEQRKLYETISGYIARGYMREKRDEDDAEDQE